MDEKELLEYIRLIAVEIQPKLLPKFGHPTRNAYAHIFLVIKIICKGSYNEVPSDKVISVVDAIKEYPNGNVSEIFILAKQLYKNNKLKSVDSSK